MHALLGLSVSATLVVGVGLPTAVAAEQADAAAVLLAGTYSEHIDPSLYWISEKFDGVRALWDGTTLRFRSGRVVPAPAWFLAALPSAALDGELWLGRGRFDALSAIVRRRQPVDDEWRQVKYLVFELPGAAGSFSERIARLSAIVERARTPWLETVTQFRVADRGTLAASLDEVVSRGGEGLMLHLADAPYLTGRRDVLLKLKRWHDAEAVVVGHIAGNGRFRGQLGALRVRAPDGREFTIGTGFSDDVRRAPPPVGAMVSYRYRDLTPGGMPRFASFLRLHEAF